jgi:chromosome segregation ATPase
MGDINNLHTRNLDLETNKADLMKKLAENTQTTETLERSLAEKAKELQNTEFKYSDALENLESTSGELENILQ